MASKRPLNTYIGGSLFVVCCSQRNSLGNTNCDDKPIRQNEVFLCIMRRKGVSFYQ